MNSGRPSYRCVVQLPSTARRRLALPLRGEVLSRIGLRGSHSLPVPSWAWAAHASALNAAVTGLATSGPPLAAGYDECRLGVEETMSKANAVLSHLLAIQPFAPFDHQAAERLLTLVETRLEVVAAQIEAGVEARVDEELLTAAEKFCAPAGSVDVRATLCEAFAMMDPPIDEAGDFRPEWVLAHYAYRTNDLLPQLLPHLASLGVPGLTDVLAAVTAVGEVLACNDPVTAYVEMNAMIGLFLAADPATSAAVRCHLTQMEPAVRRARSAAARASAVVRNSSADTEARANALVDSYKRLVEGPFRQFAWALYCLSRGTWQDPPTLGPLRERLVAAGGGLGVVAADVIIPELRNGEAHETLVWDGFAEQFTTAGVQISPQTVVTSAELAQCFIAGCEAGLTVLRFLELPDDLPLLPDHDDQGRMPVWRRVQAFFGTNRLRLLDASLNTRRAALRVERLGALDVNPCFQALVLARRLMPNVESFSVSVAGGDAVISVSADALTASMPAWEFVIAHLDQIPLSTFLPANLDARRHHEEQSMAIRSVAWIAADDAVGVIDGSPEIWSAEDRALIDTRLQAVELAVRCTNDSLGLVAPRLRSVAESVASLRQWIADQQPLGADSADDRDDMLRLRLQWKSWGPVLRHPLVPEVELPDPNERQPQLREVPKSMAFRLL